LTTQDTKRFRFTARITAPTDNWWSLFVRPADPSCHTKAITIRPLLLRATARPTRHGGQTKLIVKGTIVSLGRWSFPCLLSEKARCMRRCAGTRAGDAVSEQGWTYQRFARTRGLANSAAAREQDGR
jgi:hypothetical protein